MYEQKKLFSLDIGTRSVVGIILEEHEGQYHAKDIVIKEHVERAMLDGQIHDVLAVSRIISEIKDELETKHGPLEKVCVAAAGRALRTERAEASINISGKPMLQRQDILHLELSAVQQAQAIVAEKHEIEKSYYYYCVGYSVLYYRLDGEEIGNLIDQKGEEASVEIIATFLPKVVVESLISALHRAGLEMEALTLEPIAAINVLIPPSMRRLNVALVDIGAGTSDIAITDMGTVIAYGMVPVAGDEITEAVSDQLLLDFPLAEKAKRDLLVHDTIAVTDILGFETEVNKDDVVELISPALDRLADSICNEILSLNNRPPKAVMLIGGGSLTPDLPSRIARKLGLPENRVAIRGIDAINGLSVSDIIKQGPELVTPIGIAIAAQKSPVHYCTVYVNEQPVRLFEVKRLTVGDCLLAAGIKMNKLYGKPGLAMIVSVNAQNITIPGGHGEAPAILRNGILSSLDEQVATGDQITVERGRDGLPAEVRIRDLIDDIPVKSVTINSQNHTIQAEITCNGVPAAADQVLRDRDKIDCRIPETVEETLNALSLRELLKELKPFRFNMNGKETFLPRLSGRILRNGLEVKPHHTVEHGDTLLIEKRGTPTVKEIANLKQLILSQSIPVIFNGKRIKISRTMTEFQRQGTALSENDSIYDGDVLTVIHKKISPFIFQDLFNHVEIEMPADSTGKFILLRNGEKTTFHDPIEPGDDLKIVWPAINKKDSNLKPI
ncbi:cell division protein FtsA [Bacillus sp. ISL-47]|uniref:cell division protein FtsA n=1 Tax=Bacillus sp. ISL-47 TaxID=2819130 RepID=UPI001BE8D757|nr:cell division protein FtsA [Bacillus sp. ISL-47]MBT2691177.1 cell division protein FtsA [Bacillus sp. ISL-47]MBT2710321.1 cell division protein FtsA [Pseudomonas sp. ISL-84]